MVKNSDDLESLITPEREARSLDYHPDGDMEIFKNNEGNVTHARSFAWPLDFYRRRGLITHAEWRAGCDYHNLWKSGCVRSGFAQTRYEVRQDNKKAPETNLKTEFEYQEARKSIRNNEARDMAHQVCCVGLKAGRGNIQPLRDALNDLYHHFKKNN